MNTSPEFKYFQLNWEELNQNVKGQVDAYLQGRIEGKDLATNLHRSVETTKKSNDFESKKAKEEAIKDRERAAELTEIKSKIVLRLKTIVKEFNRSYREYQKQFIGANSKNIDEETHLKVFNNIENYVIKFAKSAPLKILDVSTLPKEVSCHLDHAIYTSQVIAAEEFIPDYNEKYYKNEEIRRERITDYHKNPLYGKGDQLEKRLHSPHQRRASIDETPSHSSSSDNEKISGTPLSKQRSHSVGGMLDFFNKTANLSEQVVEVSSATTNHTYQPTGGTTS